MKKIDGVAKSVRNIRKGRRLMFRQMSPYAEVEETGLPWCATLPMHWRLRRAKTLMRPVDIRSATGTEELLTVSSSQGVIPRSSATVTMFRAESYVGHKLCWPGDLVINSLWAWSRGLGVARSHGIVSTAYGVYRPVGVEIDSHYLHLFVRSQPFQWELQVRSRGIWKSRLQLTDERWLDSPILLPPIEEQRAIVKYVAHANARIDNAIATKRKLIALLDEQKRVIADQLLVSERWPRVRLKDVAKIQTGLTLGKYYANRPLKNFPYLRVANVQMGHVDTTEVAEILVPDCEAAKCQLHQGDVLMTEGGDIDKLGRGTVWDGSIRPCLHQNHIFAVRCGELLEPEFLAIWLSVSPSRDYFYVTAKKTTNLASTNATTVRTLPVALPSVDQQRALLSDLRVQTASAVCAIGRVSREIKLLSELRQRLTADVVTGKVDVRGIAANLPDIELPQATFDSDVSDLNNELDESLIEDAG